MVQNGATALLIAALENQLEVVNLLLSMGANVNACREVTALDRFPYF